ncbi:MAG: N-acetylneuraminate synthase [Bacteroidales bacterium]|nr:N-acetylneuraminate synthase [Bacteroidales bacterium]
MNKVIIIAEAGVNHNGDINLAEKLIDAASDAGTDYIKFQTFKTELNISRKARKARYQLENTGHSDETQFEMVKKLELSFDLFRELKTYCQSKNIEFLSTGFDLPSIDFLYELGQPFFKIPSGEITNKPYLEFIATKGSPVVMSTGMADMQEVRTAFKVLLDNGLSRQDITILHCNTEYPTPMEDVNLRAMLSIRDELGVSVGYSDHTLGIEIPIAAVAMGAVVIEKHFTLDRNLPGPDHKASLEPDELKQMIGAIRNVELALSGSGIKEPSRSEKPNIPIARKSIHLNEKLNAGTILTRKHLVMKRPGNGISPMDIDKVLGKQLVITLDADTMLLWENLKD